MNYYKQLTYYVVPSWKCNLHCPHCYVNNLKETQNIDKFINQLINCKKENPDAVFVLHGGEPTVNKGLLQQILDLNIINSIATNLLFSDDEIIKWINEKKLAVSTSWNAKRFKSMELYNIWQANLSKLEESPLVLITLDKDLLNYSPKQIIQEISKFNNVKRVLFEPLLDNTLDDTFQDKIDELLCELDTNWNIPVKNLITEQILNWNFACNTKTLLPNGEIQNKCILSNEQHKPQNVQKKCLTCKYNKVCIPCCLHTRCCFYPKFYKKRFKNA